MTFVDNYHGKAKNAVHSVRVYVFVCMHTISSMQSLTQEKKFVDYTFANESRWRNWPNFSPGENF